jgi:hypothetical protein
MLRKTSIRARFSLLVGVLLLASVTAVPEIEKVGRVCGSGICPAWWPKLDSVAGWHHEDEASFANSANVQVPDGFTFATAQTVIYARALYKPRNPETTSLAVVIKDDRTEFLKESPNVEVAKVSPLKTRDGQALETYTFFPKASGSWEEVSYGEEGDFYLIFTISSRSRAGFVASLPVYERYIAQYKK